MATTAEYNLGPYTFARGWFLLGSSEELGAGPPKTVRYFGQDMVFYRGESGAPHLVDAYCPHMGAHLGKNSTSYIVRDNEQVQGESIRCPFHGWRFGPDGQCDHVPYAKNGYVPPQAKLKAYPVVERAGTVWMWRDPEGLEPIRELPAMPEWDMADDGWVRWVIDDFGTLDIHPIELVDNIADYGHMAPVHGASWPESFENIFEGDKVTQRFAFGSRHYRAAVEEDVRSLDTWYEGPSFLQSRKEGVFPYYQIVAHTPVDDGRTRLWHMMMVRAGPGGRPATADEIAYARTFQGTMRDGLAQDLEIWENKEPCFQVMQIPFDGPYGRVRQWYKQFYNPRGMSKTLQQKTDGRVVTLEAPAQAAE